MEDKERGRMSEVSFVKFYVKNLEKKRREKERKRKERKRKGKKEKRRKGRD